MIIVHHVHTVSRVQHTSRFVMHTNASLLAVSDIYALLQTTGLPAPLAGDDAIPIKGTAVPNKDVRTLLRLASLLWHQLNVLTS